MKICWSNRSSNIEVNYIISKIINGELLFTPPRYTYYEPLKNEWVKVCNPKLRLINSESKDIVSFNYQSISVRCQKCDEKHYKNVYLHTIYKRMVKLKLIEKYPKVTEFEKKNGFREHVIQFEPLIKFVK